MPISKHLKVLLTVLGTIAAVATTFAQEAEVLPGEIMQAQSATVFLMQTYEDAGTQVLSCVGSGTIINSHGQIITNAHLAQAIGPCKGEKIIVALPIRLDQPPVPTYLAQPIQVDNSLDLAILQITGSLDGIPLNPQELNLPFVQVGEPSALVPGDGLFFVGYPDMSSSGVSALQGVITGITSEKAGSSFAWLRTDASLGGGLSGGGAFTADGRLVGIMNSAPLSGSDPGSDCLAIQDNTGDGVINVRDACVPIGSEVTSIRPITFAGHLLESAINGFTLTKKDGGSSPAVPAAPSVTRVVMASGLDEWGSPKLISDRFPSGTTNLHFMFSYDNFRDGLSYQLRVSRNGVALPSFSLGPLSWKGGTKGQWYIGTEGKTWPDGNYEFNLLVDGQALSTKQVSIGQDVDQQVFRNLVFSIPNTNSTGVVLPSGVTQVDAFFTYEGLATDQIWSEVWYYNNIEVFNQRYLWDEGPAGTSRVGAINAEGLPLGRYDLDLYIGDRLAATGSIVLVGNSSAQGFASVFYNNRLSTQISDDGLPAGEISLSDLTVPVGATELYSFIDWDFMPDGIRWTYRWYLDGKMVGSSTQQWDSGVSGRNFWVGIQSDKPLPEGSYSVEVLIENQPMFSANYSIGSGTRPATGIDAGSDEVIITGQVVDAVTGKGIPNATLFVLNVVFESPQFTWDESQILTKAVTDREGRFEFNRGLARRNFYTVYVFADGYFTIVEDNFTIPRDQPSPTEITIEMASP